MRHSPQMAQATTLQTTMRKLQSVVSMSIDNLGPHVDLGKRGVVVTSWRAIATPLIRVCDKPVSHFDGEHSLVIIDAATQEGLLVPCSREGLERIRDHINQLLEANQHDTTE